MREDSPVVEVDDVLVNGKSHRRGHCLVLEIGGSEDHSDALVRVCVVDGERLGLVVRVARVIVIDAGAAARRRIPWAEPYVVSLVLDADDDYEAVEGTPTAKVRAE